MISAQDPKQDVENHNKNKYMKHPMDDDFDASRTNEMNTKNVFREKIK